jgi:hypothetical protein
MLLKGIVDDLTLNSETMARLWIKKVRKSDNMKVYNSLSDEKLIKINSRLYKILAKWFEKEIDKNQIGAFFVETGKERRTQGFSVSEVAFAILLAQRSVIEYITTSNLEDSAMALYSIVNLTSQVADFFLLGTYYMMKGYLEDTYIALNRDEAMPDDILKKYFNDEFFFKEPVF